LSARGAAWETIAYRFVQVGLAPGTRGHFSRVLKHAVTVAGAWNCFARFLQPCFASFADVVWVGKAPSAKTAFRILVVSSAAVGSLGSAPAKRDGEDSFATKVLPTSLLHLYLV